MQRTICLVYCGGAGGNHVANMISLCRDMAPRFQSPNYQEEMLQKYKNFNYLRPCHKGIMAHFYTNGLTYDGSNVHNTDILMDDEYRAEFLSRKHSSVLNGHEFNWDALYCTFPDINLVNPLWVIFTVPSPESRPGKRIRLHEWWPKKPDRYKFPFAPGTRSEYVAHDGIVLDTELLFTESGSQYVRELLQPYDIELPIEADIAHKEWYKWMVYVTENKWDQ